MTSSIIASCDDVIPFAVNLFHHDTIRDPSQFILCMPIEVETKLDCFSHLAALHDPPPDFVTYKSHYSYGTNV